MSRFEDGQSLRANVPARLFELYEVHETNHASAILVRDFNSHFLELCDALEKFRISESSIKRAGGNESEIPKAFSRLLTPLGWSKEATLTAKTIVDDREISASTHKIDYVKGRIAIDFEWNSKDQTFDRDLFALRAFFEYDRISVGIIVTRSTSLHDYFKSLGNYMEAGKQKSYANKYGASTTHYDKLANRLQAGRHGGCPLLIFAIREALIDKTM